MPAQLIHASLAIATASVAVIVRSVGVIRR